MIPFFTITFLNFAIAIFVISISDLIFLVTLKKKKFSKPCRGYRGQKSESDFKENDYASFVVHTNLVTPV